MYRDLTVREFVVLVVTALVLWYVECL